MEQASTCSVCGAHLSAPARYCSQCGTSRRGLDKPPSSFMEGFGMGCGCAVAALATWLVVYLVQQLVTS